MLTLLGYRTTSSCLAAQNFTMPAMSPTMTEGNISSWKIKEGDSFSVGDVILEIETDKAQMDVEAQDDGILAKIMHGDGSKGIKVGSRIGVLAEEGDDLSTLEIPKDEGDSAPAMQASPKPDAEKSSPSPPSSQEPSAPSTKSSKPKKASKSGKAEKQTYPLLPSVSILLHQNGLDASDVDKMTPSGPNNRLLKGDVLAYIGSITSSYPGELSSEIEARTHLDLSNIKIKAPPPAPKAAETEKPAAVVEDLKVAVPISMAAVIEAQKRIESTLGVFMPLATFIARATDLANDDLPRSKTAKPTADELFNSILGLDAVSSSGVRGNFVPQITALPSTAVATMPRLRKIAPKSDIIDILSGKKSIPQSALRPVPGVAADTTVFSVSVPKGDEKRAKVFLERVKSVLEIEPGSLVL